MVKRFAVSTAFAAACAAAVVVSVAAGPDTGRVTVIDRPTLQRVDVLIDGQPFTSYIYPDSIKKPVLFPIRAASGAIVTRGYPLEPRPGEVRDHPHHVGHWFNYGDVNGYDFWGHSDVTPAANKPKMGDDRPQGIVSHIAGGNDRGELTVRADWKVPDGSTLLREEMRFEFSGGPARRVDRRDHDVDGRRQAGDVRRHQGGRLRHPRRARARSSVEAADDGRRRGKPEASRVDNTTTGLYIGSDGRRVTRSGELADPGWG